MIGFCIGPCFNFKGDMKPYTFCGDVRDCYSGPAFVCMKGFEQYCEPDTFQITCLDCQFVSCSFAFFLAKGF